MLTYRLTSALIGVSLGVIILVLIRRDAIHVRHTLWWVAVSIAAIFVGIFPSMFDWISAKVGVNYPPVLALVLALGLVLIKLLTNDIERSRLEIRMRRLTQRLAMLEERDHAERESDSS
jgi:hypothetical protein